MFILYYTKGAYVNGFFDTRTPCGPFLRQSVRCMIMIIPPIGLCRPILVNCSFCGNCLTAGGGAQIPLRESARRRLRLRRRRISRGNPSAPPPSPSTRFGKLIPMSLSALLRDYFKLLSSAYKNNIPKQVRSVHLNTHFLQSLDCFAVGVSVIVRRPHLYNRVGGRHRV